MMHFAYLYSNSLKEEKLFEFNQDIFYSALIDLNGTLYAYAKLVDGIPLYVETTQPHVVTIKRIEHDPR